MAINQRDLKEKASRYRMINEEKTYNFSATNKKAFLCHSHKDSLLVEGLIVLFAEAGVDIYVDWKDETMPAHTNPETAKKIQDRIRNSDLFLFLATENSMNSRWCPWEIGYGDAAHKEVLIIPTSVGYTEYGSEYLGLYGKIDEGVYRQTRKPGYFVWNTGKEFGTELSKAL